MTSKFPFILETLEFSIDELMMFITGSKSIPPLGLPSPIHILFKHGCPPKCRCKLSSSVCSLAITLPTHYLTEESMTETLIESIRGSIGFDNV